MVVQFCTKSVCAVYVFCVHILIYLSVCACVNSTALQMELIEGMSHRGSNKDQTLVPQVHSFDA